MRLEKTLAFALAPPLVFVLAGALLAGCASEDEAGATSPPPDDAAAESAPRADAGAVEVDAAVDAADQVPAIECKAAPCAVDLTAGAGHFCARFEDGELRCWGRDTAGQLGRGEDADAEPARPTAGVVVGLPRASSVAASGDTTCASAVSGEVYCWGAEAGGVIHASPPFAPRNATPVPVAGVTGRAGIRLGGFACATSAGGLVCWGPGAAAALLGEAACAPCAPGEAGLEASTEPIVDVVPASDVGYAIVRGDFVFSWGRGRSALLGRVTSTFGPWPPAVIPELRGARAIVATPARGLALVGDRLMSWGRDEPRGVLGWDAPLVPRGTTRDSFVQHRPVDVALPPGVFAKQIALGERASCARSQIGDLYCWGANDTNILGPAVTEPLAVLPVKVPLPAPVVRVAVANEAACALSRDGDVFCWGGNADGQLGRGTVTFASHREPARVAF